MTNFEDSEHNLVDSSSDISPEVLEELSAVFGNTPVAGAQTVANDEPTPSPAVPDAPSPAVSDTPSPAVPDAPDPSATVPIATEPADNSALRLGSTNPAGDIVYLDDTTLSGGGANRDDTEATEVRVVAGGLFIRLLRRFDPRRKRGRRSIAWMALALATGFVAIGIVVVATTPLLSVSTVRIEGVTYTNQKTLDEVTKMLKGDAILTLDTGPALEVLEGDPWVREASIDTKFPNTVVIDIAERTPRVWFRSTDEKFRIIDEEGRVLAVTTGQPTGYLEVTGLAPNVAPGSVAPDEYTAAAQLSMSMPEELASKVARFGVTTAGDITLSLQSGALIKFGAPNDIRQKLISVVVVLRRPESEKLVLIDVSAGEVVVK